MNPHHHHELLQRAIEIYTDQPHPGSHKVTTKGFIAVFHAVMMARAELKPQTVLDLQFLDPAIPAPRINPSEF